MKSRGAFWVMLAGTLTYLVAVTNRSSMGVAALVATDRFHVNAAALSTLAVSQLVVYSVMQIPVGILLDRFGSKKLLVFGAFVMSLGQITVGLASVLGVAVIGRMLVGLGDAFIFISVIRLVNGWFVGPKATRVQQLLTNVGQLGQAVSAIPFAALLGWTGWQTSFLTLGGISLLAVFVSAALLLDERDSAHEKHRPGTIKEVLGNLVENIKHPGVRMSFWVHFSLQSAPSVFGLLWGYPFLVSAQGIAPAVASGLLSSFVIIGFFVGPMVSWYCAAFPKRRSNLVLTLMTLVFVAWATVILLPDRTPFTVLLLLCFVLAAAGPTSMVAFDYVRTFIPKTKMGSASGFVNVGGFLATFSMMFAAGLILDAVQATSSTPDHPAGLYTAAGFKWAMTVQLLAISLGATMFLVERHKARAKLYLEEGIKLRPTYVVVSERIRRKRSK